MEEWIGMGTAKEDWEQNYNAEEIQDFNTALSEIEGYFGTLDGILAVDSEIDTAEFKKDDFDALFQRTQPNGFRSTNIGGEEWVGYTKYIGSDEIKCLSMEVTFGQGGQNIDLYGPEAKDKIKQLDPGYSESDPDIIDNDPQTPEEIQQSIDRLKKKLEDIRRY